MAGPGRTKMLASPRSSQLKVSQGDSCTCKEKRLYWVRFLPVHAVGGQPCFMGAPISTRLGFGASGVIFAGLLGISSVTPMAKPAPLHLHQTNQSWSGGPKRRAGKFGGRRRRVGAAFVRMEITVSPIQSVALFPGDNCKTGLLVLKNS